MTNPEQIFTEIDASNLRFVFWKHVDDNIPDVIPELVDSDVILLESSPFQRKADRLEAETLANVLTGGELTKRQQKTAKRSFNVTGNVEDSEDSSSQRDDLIAKYFQGIDSAIIKQYHGTGKIIRFVDVNSKDHPKILDLVHKIPEHDAKMHHETESIPNVAAMLALKADGFKIRGDALAARDDVIVGQVQDALEEFPDKKITVVYGANHSPISYDFLRNGATRTFVGPGSQAGRYTYIIDGQLERYARFGKEFPARTLNQSLLKGSVMLRLMQKKSSDVDSLTQKVRSFDVETMQLLDIADAVAQQATDEELQKFNTLIDRSSQNQASMQYDVVGGFAARLLKRYSH